MNATINIKFEDLPVSRAILGLPPIPTDPIEWKAQYCAHYVRCFIDGSDWALSDVEALADREFSKLPTKVFTRDPVHVANESLKVWWDDEE